MYEPGNEYGYSVQLSAEFTAFLIDHYGDSEAERGIAVTVKHFEDDLRKNISAAAAQR